jgi:hypothetical protein
MFTLRKYFPTRSERGQANTTSRTRATIATAAFVALSSLGVLVGTADIASANPACGDFFKILVHYVESGDQATASALFDNMVAMGC